MPLALRIIPNFFKISNIRPIFALQHLTPLAVCSKIYYIIYFGYLLGFIVKRISRGKPDGVRRASLLGKTSSIRYKLTTCKNLIKIQLNTHSVP